MLEGILALRGLELALAVGFAVLLGPLLEEIVFRGFLQPLLVQNLHVTGGIAVTSFIFVLLHGTSSVLALFALSVVLGWVHLRTRRLIAVWSVHALHNALTLTLAFQLTVE